MSEPLTPAMEQTMRHFRNGRRLRCDDVSRCARCYWLTPHGRRIPGPYWGTIEALERRGLLEVREEKVFGYEELGVYPKADDA